MSSPVACQDKKIHFAFTLIELLIVIGMLGALATLVLPSLAATKTEAFDPIVQTEMQDIRIAFQRFYNDIMPNENQLDLFRKYGLAPLMQNELTDAYARFDRWDSDRQRGWRGPYLEIEGTRTINGIKVPVIFDPYYSQKANAGHYYRVLCPGTTNAWDYQNMGLVFIGYKDTKVENTGEYVQQLDTEARITADSSADNWMERYFNNISTDDSEIVKKLVIDCE